MGGRAGGARGNPSSTAPCPRLRGRGSGGQSAPSLPSAPGACRIRAWLTEPFPSRSISRWKEVVAGDDVSVPSMRDYTDEPLPDSFVSAVEGCLAKNPAERFQSAEEAQAAFEAVLQEMGTDDVHIASSV